MRKVLAVVIIVIFTFPLLMATLTTAAVSTWVLDREIYEDIAANAKMWEALLSEDLPIYVNQRVVSKVDQVAVGALGNALRVVLTPEYLRTEAMRIVDDVFDMMEGRDYVVDIYLNLAPIKEAIAGDKRDEFANALAEFLPTCKAGEESKAPGGLLTRCIPTDKTVQQVAQEIYAVLPQYVAKYPDKLYFGDGSLDMRREMRWSETVIGLTARTGFALAIVILALMSATVWLLGAVIGGETWKSRLQWLGWSLLIPAGLVFLFGIMSTSEFTGGWVRMGLSETRFQGAEVSLAFQQTMWEAVRGLLDRMAAGFFVAGGAGAGIALGLIIWGLAMPPAVPRPQAYAQPGYPPAPQQSYVAPPAQPMPQTPPADETTMQPPAVPPQEPPAPPQE